VDGGKMSKSLGNTFTLADLKEKGIQPLAFRYFLYSANYRSKLNFTWEAVQAAQTAWERLRAQVTALGDEAQEADFSNLEAYLQDDLNIPRLVAAIWDLLKTDLPNPQKRWLIAKADEILALGLTEAPAKEPIPPEIQALAAERDEARKAKDWARSDLLRQQLADAGYAVEDHGLTSLLTRA